MATRKKRALTTSQGVKTKKISCQHRPEGMALEDWQIALRRQFGREQDFRLRNVAAEPIFSEFLVANEKSNGQYRVTIRGTGCGDNYCSCRDFAVNSVGTCKHIEFALAKLSRKRGAKRRWQRGSSRPIRKSIYVTGPNAR